MIVKVADHGIPGGFSSEYGAQTLGAHSVAGGTWDAITRKKTALINMLMSKWTSFFMGTCLI